MDRSKELAEVQKYRKNHKHYLIKNSSKQVDLLSLLKFSQWKKRFYLHKATMSIDGKRLAVVTCMIGLWSWPGIMFIYECGLHSFILIKAVLLLDLYRFPLNLCLTGMNLIQDNEITIRSFCVVSYELILRNELTSSKLAL